MHDINVASDIFYYTLRETYDHLETALVMRDWGYGVPIDDKTGPADSTVIIGDVPSEMMREMRHNRVVVAAEVDDLMVEMVEKEKKLVEMNDSLSKRDPKTEPITTELWKEFQEIITDFHDTHHELYRMSQHHSASDDNRLHLVSSNAVNFLFVPGIMDPAIMLSEQLPSTGEYLRSFLHRTYSFVTMLYDEFPTLQANFANLLATLSGVAMCKAGCDGCSKGEADAERERWAEVGRGWYDKLIDEQPTDGRWRHDRALLMDTRRSAAIQKLCDFLAARCMVVPETELTDEVGELITPICHLGDGGEVDLVLKHQTRPYDLYPPPSGVDRSFIRAHGMMYLHEELPAWVDRSASMMRGLDNSIEMEGYMWKEKGYVLLPHHCSTTLCANQDIITAATTWPSSMPVASSAMETRPIWSCQTWTAKRTATRISTRTSTKTTTKSAISKRFARCSKAKSSPTRWTKSFLPAPRTTMCSPTSIAPSPSSATSPS